MYRTFNCGIGMIAVVAPGTCDAALASLRKGETASVIGDVAAARAASSSRNERSLPVAVVISGRGSNMEAIARAAQLADCRYA